MEAASEEWRTYSLFAGIAYKVNITKKFSFFPRLGLGPLLVSNPSINAILTRGTDTSALDRSSETESDWVMRLVLAYEKV